MLKRIRLCSALVLILQLSTLSSLTLTQTACPGEKPTREQLLSWAEESVSITRDILPIFSSAGHPLTQVENAVEIGGKLITAFRDNQDADAFTLTAAFIEATDLIAIAADRFTSQSDKTLAIAITAAVRVVLRRIADKLKPAEDTGMMRAASPRVRNAVSKINAFREAPRWRCRSAQTGRFQKMEYCRQHPDVSTVERVKR